MRTFFTRIDILWVVPCLGLVVLSNTNAHATVLSATVTADDDYQAYIALSDSQTGNLFLQNVGYWNTPESGEVELTSGVINYLHIVARDLYGAPSSLIGTFTLSDSEFVFPNGMQTISTSPDYWKMGRIGFGSGYEPITDIGPNGTSPWGLASGIAVDARYIWTQYTSGEHYFSIAIIPASSDGNYRYLLDPDSSVVDDTIQETGPNPLSHTYLEGDRKALLSVDPGRTGVHIQEKVDVSGSRTTQENTILAETEFWADDFVVTTNTHQTSAMVSLNLRIHGIILGGAGSATLDEESSSSRGIIDLRVSINDSEILTGNAEIVARHEIGLANPGTELTSSSSGMLEGIFPDEISDDEGRYVSSYSVPLDTVVQTDPFEVDVGIPVKLEVRLTAQTITETFNGTALARVDLSGGVTFPEVEPVLNLPTGYTLSSPTLNILENEFEPQSPPVHFLDGIFLNLPPIAGESTAEGHENWIDLDAVSSSVFHPVVTSGGYYQNLGIPVFEDALIKKGIDKSSPKLLEALLDRTIFPEGVVEINRPLADGHHVYFEYRMKNIQVQDIQVDDKDSGEQIIEHVSLGYSYANWIYREYQLDGSVNSEFSLWWDIETGQGELTSSSEGNQPPSIDPVDTRLVPPGSLVDIDLNLDDNDSDPESLILDVTTSRPDLIKELTVTGSGSSRRLSFRTSALLSQSAIVSISVSDAFDSRSISFLVSGSERTPYEGYMSAYFTDEELANPVLSSPILDPDQDNLPTLIEYLLGTNPVEPNYESEAFQITQVEEDGVRKIRVEFRRRINDPNISGHFWGSLDFGLWERLDDGNPLYEEFIQPGDNPAFEEVTAVVTYPEGENSYFIRFHVLNQF